MVETAKSFARFLTDIVHDRAVLWGLAKNDVRAKFAASFLGSVWAFIQPLITLLVFWFVFQVGFRNPPVSDVPFVVWYAPAYLVWTFFSDSLTSGTNCLIEYSYLVKKVNFRVSIIPLVKILSASLIHIFFIFFIVFLLVVYRIPLSVYNLQVFYYFLCTIFLLVGLCWLLSAVAPFLKDTSNLVAVLIQIGFWMTPILWTTEGMNPWIVRVLKLNPMFYICQGYRDSFIDHVWFWERGLVNIYFFLFSCLIFVAGAYLFHKLRPQFADVL